MTSPTHLPLHLAAARLSLALCGVGLVACGAEPTALEPSQVGTARMAVEQENCGPAPTTADVKVWDGSAALQANKQALVAAARKLGASDDKLAVLLAMAMIETDDLDPSHRDTSKDGAGLAKNYSFFNMNGDMLSRLGYSEAAGPDLNSPSSVEAVVGLMLKAFDTFTLEGCLCFHRGGSAALADRRSYGAQAYCTGVKLIAAYLQKNPQEMTSSKRVALYLQHV